jgi:predicted DNA-binding protein with PD1-like motif
MSAPHLFRLPKDADLLEALDAICRDKGVTHATITVIGALSRASLGFYLQDEHRYVSHEVDKPVEVLAGLGSVSLKEGQPFVHLHLTLSNATGAALGGHAMPGCRIFAAEAAIQTAEGPEKHRVFDEATGLFLWG